MTPVTLRAHTCNLSDTHLESQWHTPEVTVAHTCNPSGIHFGGGGKRSEVESHFYLHSEFEASQSHMTPPQTTPQIISKAEFIFFHFKTFPVGCGGMCL